MELTAYAAIVVITAALRVASQSTPDLPDDFVSANEPSESEPAVEPEPEVSPQPAPVTPDPAGSDFIQPIPEPSITFQPVVQSVGPLATLYTSDGSFRCGGCVTQEIILSTEALKPHFECHI